MRGVRPVSNPINYDLLEEYESLDGYKILLSHHPEYWSLESPFLSQKKINLVLAGHAHGGQIKIGNQGLYASGQGWFPQYTSGIHRGQYGSMIISRGLSNPVKVTRIFNNPEIVSVQIKRINDNGGFYERHYSRWRSRNSPLPAHNGYK